MRGGSIYIYVYIYIYICVFVYLDLDIDADRERQRDRERVFKLLSCVNMFLPPPWTGHHVQAPAFQAA